MDEKQATDTVTSTFAGRKGGQQKAPTRTPDSLFSSDQVEVVLGISEGPIGGLVDGGKSFYVNGTPLINADNSSNFKDFELIIQTGAETGNAPIVPRLGGLGNQVTAGLPVNLSQNTPITRQLPALIPNQPIDYIELRLNIARLFISNAKGEFANTVEFTIEIKPASSTTWVNPVIESYAVDSVPGDSFGATQTVLPPAGTTTPTSLTHAGAVISTVAPGTANRPASVLWFDNALLNDLRPKALSGSSWVQVSGLSGVSTVGGYSFRSWLTGCVFLGTTAPSADLLVSGLVNFWISSNTVYQHNGSAWVLMPATLPTTLVSAQPRSVSITGKTTSGYVRELRLPVARISEPYDIRLTKLSPNSNTTDGTYTDISLESIAAISTAPLNFPGLATAQIVGRATDQLNSFPELSGIYNGRIIRVPSNYNPVTKVYTGVWDGTFQLAVSSNPGWVAYDLVMNTRYGLNAYQPVVLDKWACYEFGRHCDTYGFEYNDYIREPRAIYEHIDYICGLAGGKFIDYDNGYCTIIFSSDTQPVSAVFSRENVEAGLFTYAFTDVTTVKNDLTVAFINPELGWKEDRRRVFDQTHITTYGRRPDDFTAVGCTSATEAIKRARLRLVSSLTEKAVISFKTGRQGQYIQPFDLIVVCDGHTATGYASGRARTSTLVSGRPRIGLRDPIFLETGFNYTIQFQTQVGGNLAVETFTLGAARGTLSQLDVLETRTEALPLDTVFTISTTGSKGAPKRYRVTTIEPDDANRDLIAVNAVEVNPAKWAYVAGTVDLPTISYTLLNTPANPPGSLTVTPFVVNGKEQLRVSWTAPSNANVRGYNVQIFVDDTTDPLADNLKVFTSQLSYIIEEVRPVDYVISVSAVNAVGVESIARSIRHSVRGDARSLYPARNLRIEGTAGALYHQPNPVVVWDAPTIGVPEAYEVEVYRLPANTLARTTTGSTARFVYPDDQQRADNTGTLPESFSLRVRALDGVGNKSSAVIQTFSAAQAAVTGLAGTFSSRAAQLSWGYQWVGVQPSQIEAVVRVYTTAGGTLLRTVRTTASTFEYTLEMNIQDGGPRRALHFTVAPITRSGVEGVSQSVTLNNAAPAAVTASAVNDVQAFFLTIVAAVESDVAGYQVWASQTSGFTPGAGTLVYDGPDTSSRIRVTTGTWFIRVAAYDTFGKTGLNLSSQFSVAVSEYLLDIVAPLAPANIALSTTRSVSPSGEVQSIVVATWPASTSTNVAAYEVELALGVKTSGSLVWNRQPVGTALRYEWRGQTPGSTVSARVRALNKDGFPSGYTAIEDIVVAGNTTPPSDVTSFTVGAASQTVFLNWNNPSDPDLREVEIWESATSVRTAGAVIARIKGTSFVREGLTVGSTRWYWARTINTSGTAGTNFVASTPASVTTSGLGATNLEAGAELPFNRSVLVDKSNATPYAAEPNIVFLTTDKMLYRKDSTTSNGWTRAVPAAEVTGQLSSTQIADAAITTAKFASTIKPVEIVATLPVAPHTEGRMVYLTTDDKLYRNTGSGWVSTVAAADVSGQLTNAQIADLAATKISGTLLDIQLAAISASKVTGQLTNTQIADIAATKVTGQLTNAQIADLAATKVSGQLTDAQLSAIDAAKLTGQVVGTQIADAAISTAKFASGLRPIEIVATLPGIPHTEGRMVFLTTDDKLYRNTGSGWVSTTAASDVTGQLTDTQIAAIAAAKLTGQIVGTQITDGAISTPKLAAGAVTAFTIASNTITAGQIAAGTITGTQIAGSTITATQLAAGSVTAGKIAAAAITATEIAAGAITASKLLITDTSNIVKNPSFVGGSSDDWSGASAVVARTDSPVPAGAPSAHVARRDMTIIAGSPRTIAGTTTPENYPVVGTFTRAGVADWLNSAGTGLETQAASGALRRDAVRGALIEGTFTAQPVNSTLVGAVAGSPGTAPTGWSLTNPADGLTREIVGTGTSNGIPYIDVRWSGTSGSGVGNTTLVAYSSNTGAAAVNGQTWTGAAFYALVGGSFANVSTMFNRFRFNDSGGSAISGQLTDVSVLTMTGTLARFSSTGTASNASVAFAANSLIAGFVDSSAVDFTIRIGLPTLNQGQLTSPIQTTNSGAVTRAGDVLSVPVSGIPAGGDWTIAVIARPGILEASRRLLVLDDGTSDNAFVLRTASITATTAVLQAVVGGSDQAAINTATSGFANGTRVCIAIRKSGATQSLSRNGGAVDTVTPASLPSTVLTTLRLGSNSGGTARWEGFIERVIVFPVAVSDATLQSYSTLATWDGATGSAQLGATIDLNFRQGVAAIGRPPAGLPQTIAGTTTPENYPVVGTYSRAGVADWLNVAGTGLETQAASNALRREAVRGTLIEEARTNSYTNSVLTGSAIPALPTGFTVFASNGLTIQTVQRGTTNNILWVDIRFSGTSTGTFCVLSCAGIADIAASSGQTWTSSMSAALVGGSLANVSAVRTQVRFVAGAANTAEADMSLSATLVRQPVATGVAGASVTHVTPAIALITTNGAAIDITLRLALVQLEQAASALSPIQTTNSGTVTRAADVLSVPVSGIAAGGDWTIAGVARMPLASISSSHVVTVFSDGTNSVVFRRGGGDPSTLLAQAIVASVGQGGISTAAGVVAPGALFGFCMRRQGGNLSISINGATPITGASSLPAIAPTSIGVGHNGSGSSQWNSFIERVIIFPTAASDATLQSYSTLATWSASTGFSAPGSLIDLDFRLGIQAPIQPLITSSLFALRPGEVYYIEATVASTAIATGGIELRLNCVDVDGANGSWVSAPGTTDRRSAPNTTWGVISGLFTVPATVLNAAIPTRGQVVVYTDDLGSWFVTNVVCRRAATGELIVDGAITANKILTGSITATQIAGATITADKIATGTITATQISSGSITATQLASGSVTAAKAAFGNGDNLAVNSDVLSRRGSTAPGWTSGIGTVGTAFTQVDLALIGTSTWRPLGCNAYYTHFAGTPALNTYSDIFLRRADLSSYPVVPGRKYEVSFWISAHRSSSAAKIWVYDSAMAYITEYTGNSVTAAISETSDPATTVRSSLITPALPANARFVSIGVRTTYDGVQATPYTFVSQAFLAEAQANQTEFSPWVPSGATLIDGGGIITRTLTADRLVANSITAAELQTDSVTANAILAGTITGAKIAGTTITAANIASGTITATQLAAGSVTATKLVVTDFENLIENPHFGEGDVGWVRGTGVTIVNDPANAFIGNWVMQLGVGANGIAARNSLIFPVVPGQEFYVEARAKSVGASHAVNLRIRFLQADKSTFAGNLGVQFLTTDTAYTLKSVTGAAPAGAVYAWVDFNPAAALTAGRYDIGYVRCQRRNAGELIVDGTITANKITAGTITATQLAANSITSTQLSSNSVTAGKIEAGAVGATQIAAQAVTAAKLFVGDNSNALLNGSFRASNGLSTSEGWTLPTGSTVDRVLNTTEIFQNRLNCTGRNAAFLSTRIQVTPGEQWYVEGWVFNQATELALIYIGFLDVDLATVSGTNAASTGVKNSWTRINGIVTVPTGAALLDFVPFVDRVDGVYGTQHRWTGLKLRRASGGELIVDGAVVAQKIAANAVTTNKLLVTGRGPAINSDPNTQDISAWIGTGISIATDTTSPVGTTVLRCTAYDTILSQRAQIDPVKNYQFRIWARQQSGSSTAYLTVAFYNSSDANLDASYATGWPAGGTYFYFGLVNQQPPGTWTEYRISFGPNETAKIPAAARFARVGVLANYTGSGTQDYTGIQLMLKADADLIVDGAIVAGKIATNAVTADKIFAGSVTTAKLAAESVTASKLVVGAVSGLLPNGGFEEGLEGWLTQVVDATVSVGTTAGNSASGNQYLVMTRNTSNGSSYSFIQSKLVPVESGAAYELTASVRSASSASTSGFYLRALFYDSSQTYLSQIDVASNGPVAASYTRVGGQLTVPANAVFSLVQVYHFSPSTAATIFVDNIRYLRATGSTLIEDGAITTGKISSNAVNADKIAAGAVTSAKLTVSAARNVVYNSDFLAMDANSVPLNWTDGGNDTGLTPARYSTDLGGFSTYAPVGMKGFIVWFPSGAPANGTVTYIHSRPPTLTTWYTCVPGQRYEFSVYLSVARCTAYARLYFFDAAGAYITNFTGNPVTAWAGANASLAAFPRSSGFGIAPANAVRMTIYILSIYDGNPVSPYTLFSGAYIGEALPNQTELSPYGVAASTIIHGDQMQTGTLNANRIVTNSITAVQLAANSITADKLKVNSQGLSTLGLDFQIRRTGGALTHIIDWTSGYVFWTNSAGTAVATLVNAGSFDTAGSYTYFYWTVNTASIAATTDWPSILNNPDRVVFAFYGAGSPPLLNVTYGSTIVDGARISATSITATQIAAGTITAGQIATGTITADRMAVSTLSAISANVGTVTAGVIQSADGKFVINLAAGSLTLTQ
jgi:predicted phage tail protein